MATRTLQETAIDFLSRVVAGDVRQALQDGDHVAVHSRVRRSAGEPDIAVVHIFLKGRTGRATRESQGCGRTQ